MQKGGNICNKFVITKQQRESLYRSVTADSKLAAIVNRASLVYNKVVAGVSKALENTNTGWKIDNEFIGDNQSIVPNSILPNIESTSFVNNSEIWEYNIPPYQSAYDGGGQKSVDNTVGCITTDSTGRVFTCSSWQTLNYTYVLLLKCFEDGNIVASAAPAMGLTIQGYNNGIIPLACGITQSGTTTYIYTLCKCKQCYRDSQEVRIVLFKNSLSGSTFSACTIIDISGEEVERDGNYWPIVSATWNKYSSHQASSQYAQRTKC